jgi:hypothetical protein
MMMTSPRPGLGQKLERHRRVAREIGGAIDFAYAAAPQQPRDAIAAATTMPGTKRPSSTARVEESRGRVMVLPMMAVSVLLAFIGAAQ